jgi:hypothetical protein
MAASSALLRGFMPFRLPAMTAQLANGQIVSKQRKEAVAAKKAVVRKEKKATKTLGIVVGECEVWKILAFEQLLPDNKIKYLQQSSSSAGCHSLCSIFNMQSV